jgi:pimeloyl-ACP methyl ester carboxylesterase
MPVVGVSMGAGVALALASTRLDGVKWLVLIRRSWPARVRRRTWRRSELSLSYSPNSAPRQQKAFASSAILRGIEIEAPAMAQSLLGQFRRRHARERARVLAAIPRSLPIPDRAAYRSIAIDLGVAG